MTESSEHFAEYVPWFIKDGRDDLIERFNIPLDEYLRRCEAQLAEWQAQREELEGGGSIGAGRSHEYGADIVRRVRDRRAVRFNGNVPNRPAAAG